MKNYAAWKGGPTLLFGVNIGHGDIKTREPSKAQKGIHLCCLQEDRVILLALPLRFYDVPRMHAGEPLGDDLQPDYLDLSRLRGHSEFWQPVEFAVAQG